MTWVGGVIPVKTGIKIFIPLFLSGLPRRFAPRNDVACLVNMCIGTQSWRAQRGHPFVHLSDCVLLGCFSIDFVLLDIKNMVIMDAANIFLVIHKEARFKVIINANLIGKSLTI